MTLLTKNKRQQFRKFQKNDNPLLRGNVWDVQNVRAYEKLGYQAHSSSEFFILTGVKASEIHPLPKFLQQLL